MEVRIAGNGVEVEHRDGRRAGSVKASEYLRVVVEARGESGEPELGRAAENVVVYGLVRSEGRVGVRGEAPFWE